MARYNINIEKTYRIPEEISIQNYEDKILVIAPQFANWIVLESFIQFSVFEYFRQGHSIQEALVNKDFKVENVNYVVTQLEAKRFCNKEIHSSTIDERSMHLYLTNKCNLTCPHCYMFSGKANEGELTTEEILKLLSDYRTLAKGNSLTLSGGEPSSHKDFDIIVKAAYTMGLEVKVLTNGTLMTPKRIENISQYIHSVQISIDGFSEETNSTIRGKHSFKKALIAVDSFIKQGVKTSIAITPPISILKEHIQDYANFALNLSLKYQDKNFQIKFAEEMISGREINLLPKEKKDYFSYIHKIQTMIYGDDYDSILFARKFYNDSIFDNCMFGSFAIASNGDVYYCARIEDLSPVANIRTTSLKDIYTLSKAAEKATLITNLSPCNKCELRFICGGGCRIEEFPELVKRTSFDDFNCKSIKSRSCSQKMKNRFYRLMINSNPYLYKTII